MGIFENTSRYSVGCCKDCQTCKFRCRSRTCVYSTVAQYLRWTLHFALLYEPIQDLKWNCYTDVSSLSLYGHLNEMILSKPPYITYCDNSAAVQLAQQLSASKTRTRHLPMRASWLHHLVKHENVSMQFVPTAHQKADILTRGFTAYMNLLDLAFDYKSVMACKHMHGLSRLCGECANVQVVDLMFQTLNSFTTECEANIWLRVQCLAVF